MSKLKTTAQLGLGAGGAISTVCGLVADFFMPVAPYGIYLGFGGLLLLLLSLGLFFIPATDKRLGELLGDSWYLPSFVLLSIFTVSMFSFYYMGKTAPGASGYLAGSFEELSKLQSELLLSTKGIESNTANIADNTREIADTVKKETSEDPRKELANMGIAWNYENFLTALGDADMRAVNLFMQDGMKVRGGKLGYYMRNHYSESGIKAIISNRAVSEDSCPGACTGCSSFSASSDLSEFKKRPLKAELIVQVCGDDLKESVLNEIKVAEIRYKESKKAYEKVKNMPESVPCDQTDVNVLLRGCPVAPKVIKREQMDDAFENLKMNKDWYQLLFG